MAHEHQSGTIPKPDLANLDRYMEAGIDHDHEQHELLGFADYHGLYRAKLARLHSARPIPADALLWTKDEIDRADSRPVAAIAAPPRKLTLQDTSTPVPQRKTGTR